MMRLCLLLLLAVLLPWRGAVAAAMLCPPAGVPVQQASHAALPQHHVDDAGSRGHDGRHGHDAQAHHGHHGPDEPGTDPQASGSAGMADASHTGHDKQCNLCAATCSVTALTDQASELHAPFAIAASRYPSLVTPVPDFLSSGQERPPRSI